MGKIFCVMGKSASGKDTIYNKILQDDSLMLSRIIPYTTRPIRDGETQDKDYHFCNEEDVKKAQCTGAHHRASRVQYSVRRVEVFHGKR